MATYNVLNLFDQADDPALQGEYDDIRMATSRDRCAELAKTILAVDADIVALQEIESIQALSWFRDNFMGKAGYKHLASEDVGYYRGVECGVMSRFPILETKVWLEESLDAIKREGPGWAEVPPEKRRGLKFQRSPLMVRVKIDKDYELTVFSIHHKAGADFDYHREAEAARIVELIDSIRRDEPNRNIAVMGDFNAAPSDKSVRVYLQGGMIDAMAHRVWQGDGPEVMLYKTHDSNRVLDYILLNSASHREYVIGSAFVYGTMRGPPGFDSIRDQPPPGYASDHYPVAIDLIPQDQP